MGGYNLRKRMTELIKYSGTSHTMLSNGAVESLERKRTTKARKLAS